MISERDYMRTEVPEGMPVPPPAMEWVPVSKASNKRDALILGIILCLVFLPAGVLFLFFAYKETTIYELRPVAVKVPVPATPAPPTVSPQELARRKQQTDREYAEQLRRCREAWVWIFKMPFRAWRRFVNYLKTGYPTLDPI